MAATGAVVAGDFAETTVFLAPVAATLFVTDFVIVDFAGAFALSEAGFAAADAFAAPDFTDVPVAVDFFVVSRAAAALVAVPVLFDFMVFLEDDIHEYSSAARCGDGRPRRQAHKLRPDGRVT